MKHTSAHVSFHGSSFKCCLLAVCLLFFRTGTLSAAPMPIAEIIRQGVKRVIIAVDLKIQRLQNETIWLQNACKVMENTLSELRLEEISEWTERQQQLYQDYYQGLWTVKSMISQYQRVKEAAARQAGLVEEYRQTWNVLVGDGNFSSRELAEIQSGYQGILAESVHNLDQLMSVLKDFTLQMDDSERLGHIRVLSEKIETNYRNLTSLNRKYHSLNRQRSRSGSEANTLKELFK